MLSALIFLLPKIFLTGWVIRYSGHSSRRCSYDSNRENVNSVKSLCDNNSHYRGCLSRCRNTENRPGRVRERSCSPPPAPRQAQPCRSSLAEVGLTWDPPCPCPHPQFAAPLADSPAAKLFETCVVQPKSSMWHFLRLFLLILWSCRTILQMLMLLPYFSPAFPCLSQPSALSLASEIVDSWPLILLLLPWYLSRWPHLS